MALISHRKLVSGRAFKANLHCFTVQIDSSEKKKDIFVRHNSICKIVKVCKPIKQLNITYSI